MLGQIINKASGYYDQPHLVREFRELTGLAPVAFMSRNAPGARARSAG